jgi:hypothetical protein
MISRNPFGNLVFFPEIESEAKNTLDAISQTFDLPTDFAKMIQGYLGSSPKIQVWNDYPGRATLRSQNHEIYLLNGLKRPIGPLGVTDEKGSYSLSRRLISPLSNLLEHVLTEEPDPDPFLKKAREKVILTKLYNGMVSTQEVAEHQDTAKYYFAENYLPDEDSDVEESDFRDFSETGHKLLPSADPVFLIDQNGEIVRDAQTVVTANWYVLTLTRSGDLYFNQKRYMENVQSIAAADTREFILILDKEHKHEYHRNKRLIEYLQDQDTRGPIDDIKTLRSYGENHGARTALPSVVDQTTCIRNDMGFMCLMTNGRIDDHESNVPVSLMNSLEDKSNYIEKIVASKRYFGALLRRGNGSQEVYIWCPEKENSKLHPYFQKENSEDGKSERKRIVDIVASFPLDFYNGTDVFAINFEDDTSRIIFTQYHKETSFPKRVQRIRYTQDGILVVDNSGELTSLRYLEDGKIERLRWRGSISFTDTFEGFVLLYPRGGYKISKGARAPPDILDRFKKAGGIAEIYSDSSFFYAVLMDGTVVSW